MVRETVLGAGSSTARLEALLQWYERWVLKPDLRTIKVDRPIFLIGLPRSGTTMLQDLLCTHPEMAYITNTMHQLRKCFCSAEVLRKHLRLDARGERFVGDSVTVDTGSASEAVVFWAEWLKWDPYSLEYRSRRRSDFTSAELAHIDRTIRQVIWCFAPHARRFFSKNTNLIPDLPLLAEIFPDAKFVHIVRDARLCANSMLKLYEANQRQLDEILARHRHGIFDERPLVPYPRFPKLPEYMKEFGGEDIRTPASLWNDSASYVRECRSLLPAFYEVRFEDILANPHQEVGKIFEFCELSPVTSDNQAYEDKISAVGVVRHKNKYTGFDLVTEICRDNLRRHGYALET